MAAQAGNPIGAAAPMVIDDAEATGKPSAEKKADAAVAVGQVAMSEIARAVSRQQRKMKRTSPVSRFEEVIASVKQTPSL